MKPTDWKDRIMFMAVLYAMLEQGKTFSTLLEGEDAFLEPVLDEMFKRELVDIDARRNAYVVTKKGEELRTGMVGMYDQLLKFEIFGSVNQGLALAVPNQAPEEDPNAVYDNILDPRFVDVPGTSEDLRLAMLNWLGTAMTEQLGGKQVDPYQVVFLQKLRAGQYKGPDFWFHLRTGTVFDQIQGIVDKAVKWTQLAATPEEAHAVMNAVYTAGMIEQRKRDGQRCTCGAYLAMYEYWAQKEGKTFDMCPCCQGSFNPIAPTEQAGQECPNCGTDIFPNQRSCTGCGAKIDRRLKAGTVRTDTTVTTETDYVAASYYWPWSGSYVSYGYSPPIVYYDPWNPVADALAFGLICGLLL